MAHINLTNYMSLMLTVEQPGELIGTICKILDKAKIEPTSGEAHLILELTEQVYTAHGLGIGAAFKNL